MNAALEDVTRKKPEPTAGQLAADAVGIAVVPLSALIAPCLLLSLAG